MDKDLFIQKYGENSSIKQAFLRKAYQNYFMLKSSINKDKNKRVTKVSIHLNIHQPKSKQIKVNVLLLNHQVIRTTCITYLTNFRSQMTEFHYNKLKSKWLMDDKQNEVLISIMQRKRKQLELEEKQRELEISKIQQAIQLRENLETDRKRQFYKESELFRNQQSERKYLEQEKLKSKEQEYLLLAKRMAKNEELAKLEEQIVHRQKCKLQFQMLEQQRKTNSFLLS